MRIEQLQYVVAIARLGSYRRAAEALYISQPALSESVRALERELGVDLLARGRQGAEVSGAGRRLLPHFFTVPESVDRLRDAADDHQSRRVVSVGTVNTGTRAGAHSSCNLSPARTGMSMKLSFGASGQTQRSS